MNAEKDRDILDEYMDDIDECIQTLDEVTDQPKVDTDVISCRIYKDERYYVGKTRSERDGKPAYMLCLIDGEHAIELARFWLDETGERGMRKKEYITAMLAMTLYVYTRQDDEVES